MVMNEENSFDLWDEVCKASSPWKATGPDGIPNWFWKHIPRAKEELYKQVIRLLSKTRRTPAWFSKGRAVLLYKKGDRDDPGLIAKWIRMQIDGIWPAEQLACKKGVWGCTEAHVLDATVMRDATNQKGSELSMAWIDFSKAFDSIPHKYLRWVLNSIGLHPSVCHLLKRLMDKWSIYYEQRTSRGMERSKALKVQNGVLQGDSLSPILFCICIAPISHWLNNRLQKYETSFRKGTNDSLRMNHLYFVDDLKLFTPSKTDLLAVLRELESLLSNIGCKMNKGKSGISYTTKFINKEDRELKGEFPIIRNEDPYKYLGIEQSTYVCQSKVLDRVTSTLIVRTEQIFSSKLNVRQMVSAYNCMVPAVVRFIYTNIIIGRGKFQSDRLWCLRVDQKVREILVKCKLRFASQNTYRIYAKPENGGLGLKALVETFEDSIVYAYCYLTCSPKLQVSLRFMESLDRRGKRSLISDFRRVVESNGINCKEFPQVSQMDAQPGLFIEGNVYKHPTLAARAVVGLMCANRELVVQKALGRGLGETAAPGYAMMALISDYKRWNLDPLRTWDWIKKGFICPLVFRNVSAAQENNLSYTGAGGWKSPCRWGCNEYCNPQKKAQETVAHIVANCDNWASTIYVERHNMVASRILYELCVKYDLPVSLDNQRKQPVIENEKVKIYWDRPMDCVKVQFNRPDIVCFIKKPGSRTDYAEILVIEVSVVWYQSLLAKEKRKFEKYAVNSMEISSHPGQNLRGELQKLYKCPVRVIPMIVGVFGEVSENLMTHIQELSIPSRRAERLVERMSRAAVLGTHWVIKAHMSGNTKQTM
uniref:Reverse transcriptase domain-containing protein n=1 Tax=Meloidogyne incognita TaxID=6306 RepID=A0A914NTP9_MELIC